MADQKKILLVDGQIFQSAARDRGMGRYSEYLLRHISQEEVYTKIIVIFSKKNLDEQANMLDLSVTLPRANQIHLDLMNTSQQTLEHAREHNTRIIDQFVGSLEVAPDLIDFIIPSPFQEPIVSVFPKNANKFIIFYDLIPYLHHDRYADKMPFENYLKRFNLIFEADKILTISQAVKDDLLVYLGLPMERIVSIDGAAIKSDKKPAIPVDQDLPDKFILMPTSDDPRKNNLRAVLGFEEFRVRTNSDLKLVITSKIHPTEQNRLKSFSRNLIFTDNLPEEELDWLYGHAEIVLFVPESEGLGLPLLESLQVGKRVVCSDIEVFREISKEAFYFCDFEDHFAIAGAIEHAMKDRKLPVLKSEYTRVLRHYSWPETAKRAIRAMNVIKEPAKKKSKVAIFTPTPDGYSAVGKVVAEGHASLSACFDIDYYVEAGIPGVSTRPNFLQYVASCYPAESFSVDDYKKYDAVFYHIGNSEYHLASIGNGLYLPGYVILHDTNISDAYRVMVERGVISKERNDLEARITTAGGIKQSKHLGSLVTNQLGVIAHSSYAVDAAKELIKNQVVPTKRVNLATVGPTTIRRRNYDRLNIGMAGIIANIKGIEVIERLANDKKYREHHISIFGYNYADAETVERLTSYENVSLSTDLTDLDFANNMRKLDIFVNYRMQYQGETSLSTLEAMRQGVVVFVRNIGWYSELPDEAVVKVDSIEDLTSKLERIREDRKSLVAISEHAVRYVRNLHSHEQYAKGIEGILKDVRHDPLVEDRVEMLRLGKMVSKQSLIDSLELEK